MPVPKPVNYQLARTKLEREIGKADRAMRAATEALNDGRISITEWRDRMAQQIRNVNGAAAFLSVGGRGLTADEVAAMEDRIAEQNDFLDRFAKQLRDGTQPLGDGATNRASMYAGAARGTFEQAKGQLAEAQGLRFERNILGPSDHCKGVGSCIEQTRRGWQPIGTLVPVGQRLCVSNCRCKFVYKTAKNAQQVFGA